MKRLEEFDEKFVLKNKELLNVIGGKASASTKSSSQSTCDETSGGCGDTKTTTTTDDGKWLSETTKIYDVTC